MVCGSLDDLVCFVSCMFNVTQSTKPYHFYISQSHKVTSTAALTYRQTCVFGDICGIATFSLASWPYRFDDAIFQRFPFFCISSAAGVNGLSSRWQLDQSGDTSVYKPRPHSKPSATVCQDFPEKRHPTFLKSNIWLDNCVKVTPIAPIVNEWHMHSRCSPENGFHEISGSCCRGITIKIDQMF